MFTDSKKNDVLNEEDIVVEEEGRCEEEVITEKKGKKGKKYRGDSIEKPCKKPNKFNTTMIASVAIFSAVSVALYLLTIFVPFNIFAGLGIAHLSLHIDVVPMLIAGFAYGPLAGFLVIFIKTLISLIFTSFNVGSWVGIIADFVISGAMVVSAAWIYKNDRTLRGAITALVISSFVQIGFAVAANLYFLVPMYAFTFGISVEDFFAGAGYLESFYYKLLIPFNVIQNVLVSVLTFFTYKATHRLINRVGSKK